MEPTIHSITAESEHVVEFEGTLINGEAYCNQYCIVIALHDGKIRKVSEYFCTILADKKLWPLVAGMEL